LLLLLLEGVVVVLFLSQDAADITNAAKAILEICLILDDFLR